LTHAATPDIYTLSLHDALPISRPQIWKVSASLPCCAIGHRAAPESAGGTGPARFARGPKQIGLSRVPPIAVDRRDRTGAGRDGRSEEHTSELQSRRDLVCRLLL